MASGWNRRFTWLIVGVLAMAMIGGLAFYRPFHAQPDTPPDQVQAQITLPPPAKLPGKRTTFLVMGVDKRPDDAGRSDSMIVASYNSATQQVAMLSLPRDTWVEIPGYGYDKLNHSYAFGGEKLAVATVQKLLGVPIDHYVTVSFQGFAKIIDAVGGIEIDAEKRMYYEDPFDLSMGPEGLIIDIQPGLQKMDGLTALKYARFRMDEEGDVGRMRRQQQMIKAVIQKVADASVITRIPQLIPALYDTITTDMSIADILKLATGARSATANPLKTGTLGGMEMEIGGIFYWMPDIVQERTQAYSVLVGEPPSESFLRLAREDQEAYSRALAEAMEHSAPTSAEAGDGSDSGEGEQPAAGDDSDTEEPAVGAEEPGTSENQPGEGAQQPGQEAPPPGEQQPAPAPTKPPKAQPITVAVIDASGQKIAATYVQQLKAAGFRVARTSRAQNTVPRTVALDHAGQAGTAERIHSVLPVALIVNARHKSAAEAVEIILGTDLIQN